MRNIINGLWLRYSLSFQHVQQWPKFVEFRCWHIFFLFLRRYFGCALRLNGIKIDYKQQMRTIRTIIASQMPKCQYNKTSIEHILLEIAAKICSDDETKILNNSTKNRFYAIKRHIVRLHMKKKTFLSQTVFVSPCLMAFSNRDRERGRDRAMTEYA